MTLIRKGQHLTIVLISLSHVIQTSITESLASICLKYHTPSKCGSTPTPVQILKMQHALHLRKSYYRLGDQTNYLYGL